MAFEKEVLVVGGGPGGYVAALRCAQLGAKVKIVENDKLGGTCLNRGCIPTKSLLQSTGIFELLKKSSRFGVKAENISIDFKEVINRKNSVARQLVDGVGYLLASNKIEIIKGKARFINQNQVEIISQEGDKYNLDFENVIIATGSISAMLPIPGMDADSIITSDQALEITDIPADMIIIGGGVIGVEFATIFNSIGVNVTIIEAMPQLLSNTDFEAAEILRKALQDRGVEIYLKSKIEAIDSSNNTKSVKFTDEEGKNITLSSEKILLSVGRRPNIEGLGLENTGVIIEKGKIVADEYMRTNISNIYAVGDVVGKILLAHVASREGIVAAENIFGNNVKMNYNVVPSCIFTRPEIASVGLTEKNARLQGYELKIGKFPFKNNGKSMVMDESIGFVKIIAEAKYGEVLGVHIIGPNAPDLIHECALAVNLGCTVEEIIDTIHSHPTLGESIAEAALDTDRIALHIPKQISM